MNIDNVTSPVSHLSSGVVGEAPPRGPSAFERLKPDVIFEIMMHNINMDNDPPIGNAHFHPHFAMNVLRSASQINRTCRSVAVVGYSASLWSRVLNLNLLFGLKNTNWFNLVYSRIGRSNFDVKCEFVGGMYPHGALYVLKFIEENWGRIRKLDIGTLEVEKLRTDMDYRLATEHLRFLALPTNALQSINIRLACVPGTNDILEFRLFNDVAPALREFHCSNVKIDKDAPWMSNLCSLHVEDYQSRPLLIRQLCSLLSRTPQLKYLEIRQPIVPLGAIMRSQISVDPIARLPQLRNLVIDNRTDLNACWEVAEFIRTHSGCCLVFKPATLRPNEDLSLGANILHKYLNDFNIQRLPSFLRIVASPTALQINDHTSPEWTRKWHGKYVFNIEIPFYPHMDQTAAGLLKMVYKCDYSSVVHLELDISPDLIQPDPKVPDPSFPQFIQSFQSVKVLTTTADTMKVLCNNAYKDTHTLVFPQLRTLKMFELKFHPRANYLGRFLARQWNAGIPVKVFEFTLDGGDPNPRLNFKDLQFLDIFDGMIVKWRHGRSREQHEYLCGSGRPKELFIVG